MKIDCRPALHLLMTADTLGGVWDYAMELVAGLSRQGVTVTLATMGRPLRRAQRRAAAGVVGLRLAESSYRLEWMPEAGLDLVRAGKWLLELERETAPDLIHLNGYCHAGLAWQAPCLVVAHSCVLSWWQAVRNEPAPPEWQEYEKQVRKGLRKASLVAAPTRAMLEAVGRHYGSSAPGVVIHNGRPAASYPPAAKEPFLFSAGRVWDEAKNIGAVAAVAPALPWPVYAAGEWRRPEGGGAPPPNLRCLGVLPPAALAGWLGRAAIYVLPARYEPFGLSVLEAALAGCALVLGDIPSLRELWEGAARFVKPDNQQELQQVLLELIGDLRLRRRLGQVARRRGLGYSADRMVQGYLEVYGQLLRRGRRLPTASVMAFLA